MFISLNVGVVFIGVMIVIFYCYYKIYKAVKKIRKIAAPILKKIESAPQMILAVQIPLT